MHSPLIFGPLMYGLLKHGRLTHESIDPGTRRVEQWAITWPDKGNPKHFGSRVLRISYRRLGGEVAGARRFFLPIPENAGNFSKVLTIP